MHLALAFVALLSIGVQALPLASPSLIRSPTGPAAPGEQFAIPRDVKEYEDEDLELVSRDLSSTGSDARDTLYDDEDDDDTSDNLERREPESSEIFDVEDDDDDVDDSDQEY